MEHLPGRPVERTLFSFALGGFVVALVLAWIGAGQYLAELGQVWTFADRAYLVVQTFTLQLSSEPGPVPYPAALQVARFLGPIVLAYAAARTLVLLLRDLVDEYVRVRVLAWRPFRGGHTIVCGVGHVGGEAVRTLRPDVEGWFGSTPRRLPWWRGSNRVVAIEVDRNTGRVQEGRDRGVPFIFGDATDEVTWRRARARKAERILVACGSDQLDGEAVATVRRVLQDARGPVVVAVHLEDPELALRQRRQERRRVRARAEEGRPPSLVAVEAFSLPENGATRLLARYPPPPAIGEDRRQVVVVGASLLAGEVVRRVAHFWSTSGPVEGGPQRVLRVVDPDASRLVGRLRRRFPDVDDVLELHAVDQEVDCAAVCDEVLDGDGDARTYVCGDDERSGLAAGVLLADAIERLRPAPGPTDPGNPVVVCTGPQDGLAQLVVGEDDVAARRLVGASPLALSCDPVTVFGPHEARMARMAHEAYQGLASAFPDPDRDPDDDPSFQPWDDGLLDELKHANHQQVDEARVHYARVGVDPTQPPIELETLRVPLQVDDDEMWALAEAEHERWVASKVAAGFRQGPRDRAAKTHPDIRPWDELDERTKEKDREAVQSYVRSLAALGLRLPRRTTQGDLGRPGWEQRAS